MRTFAHLRESLKSRRRSVLATVIPLVAMLGFWTVLVVQADRETIENSAQGVLVLASLCALGPLASYATPDLPLIAGVTIAALLWTAWIATVVWTHLGRLHWGVHLIASTLWCEVGFFYVAARGLGV